MENYSKRLAKLLFFTFKFSKEIKNKEEIKIHKKKPREK